MSTSTAIKKLLNTKIIKLLPAFLVLSGVSVAQAAEFTSIRIGDKDGFGFTTHRT